MSPVVITLTSGASVVRGNGHAPDLQTVLGGLNGPPNLRLPRLLLLRLTGVLKPLPNCTPCRRWLRAEGQPCLCYRLRGSAAGV